MDAHDNGISAYPNNLTPLFKESPTSLPSRVGQKNPDWNEELTDAEIDVRGKIENRKKEEKSNSTYTFTCIYINPI